MGEPQTATSAAAEGPGQRRVRFAGHDDLPSADLATAPVAAGAPDPGPEPQEQRLGYGHLRMTEEQLEVWAQTDLVEAAAPRSTTRLAVQEAAWAAEANVDGRGHWSVREAARLYGHRFQQAAADFHFFRTLAFGLAQPQSALASLPAQTLAHIADFAAGLGPMVEWVAMWPRRPARAGSAVLVAARKRPLQPWEEGHGEWNCVEADTSYASLVLHDGRLARNGKQLDMVHRRYLLDRVWGESAGNEEVSREALSPLLAWARRGRAATLLCYGQTGAGKTHTLSGMLEFLAGELDGLGDAEAQFFEIRGQKLHDLLNDRAEVQLNADADGRFQLRGATNVQIRPAHGGAEALRRAVAQALELRTSEATERNPVSSRSHAVLLLRLKERGGTLRFVDLAGSERNYETERMTAAQHKESAHINRSLMALKDCFRAHAALGRGEAGARLPIRASRLTQCLRDCFEDRDHRFLIVAAISPRSTDVIHTVNTLNHAVMMAKCLEDVTTELQLRLPLGSGVVARRGARMAEWTAEEVADWVATVEMGRFAQLVLPPGLNGEGLLALSKQRLSTLFERTMRTARAGGEGQAWNITGYEEGRGSGEGLGRALFAAVRQEALAAVRRNAHASPLIG